MSDLTYLKAFYERWHRLMPGVHSTEHLTKIYGLVKDSRRPDLASELILSADPKNALTNLQAHYPAIYRDDGVVEQAEKLLSGVPGSLDSLMADANSEVPRLPSTTSESVAKDLIQDVGDVIAAPPKNRRTYTKRKQPPAPEADITPDLVPSDPSEPLTGNKTPVESSSQLPVSVAPPATPAPPTAPPPTVGAPPTPEPPPAPSASIPTSAFPQVDLTTQPRSAGFDAIGSLSQQLFMSAMYANQGAGSWMAQDSNKVNGALDGLRATLEDPNLNPKLREAMFKRFGQGKDEINLAGVQDGNMLASVNDSNSVDSVVTDVALSIKPPDPWQLDMQSRQNALRRELQPWGSP